MIDGKGSFIVYTDVARHLDRLTDEEAGRLFKGLVAFAADGTEPANLSPAAGMAFSFISAQITRDAQKWAETREKRREAGRKGGVTRAENSQANLAFAKQSQANKAVTVSVPVPAPAPATVIKDTICAEPEPASTPPVIALPLNDGAEYSILRDQFKEWESLYPAVDVMQQLRTMRGWLLSNPDKRKTKRGINRFITGWLAKEQDRGGSRANAQSPAPSERNYDVLKILGGTR